MTQIMRTLRVVLATVGQLASLVRTARGTSHSHSRLSPSPVAATGARLLGSPTSRSLEATQQPLQGETPDARTQECCDAPWTRGFEPARARDASPRDVVTGMRLWLGKATRPEAGGMRDSYKTKKEPESSFLHLFSANSHSSRMVTPTGLEPVLPA